jgi:CRP/FNR family cyclic AMP-dependent transcriptional regulator
MDTGDEGGQAAGFFAAPQRGDAHRATALAFEVHGTRHAYPQGVSIVSQGEEPIAIWRIASGLTKSVWTGPAGNQTMVALRGAGWLVGVNSALLHKKSPVSVITATPCMIGAIGRQVLEGLIKSDVALWPALLALQAAEIEDLTVRCGELAAGSSRARLMRILRLLLDIDRRARQRSPKLKLQLPVREWELAQFVAVTPAHLCRLLGALEKDRLLRRNKGWLEILDADKFAKDSEGT